MRKRLRGLGLLIVVAAFFGGMQYWAVKARERDWWWFGGGPNHMTFLDLSEAKHSEGHLLLVERVPDEEITGRLEYEFSWSCQKNMVRWGTMWEKDDDLEQVQRHPAPKDQSQLHVPKNVMEGDALSLACANPSERKKLRTLQIDRSPVRFANDAFKMVEDGARPFDALMKAARRTD